MPTAPTRVATVVPATGNYTTTTSPKVSAALPALNVGDIIVVVGGSEQAGTNATVTPTASAGSVTWTLRTSQMTGTTNQSGEKLWTGVVGAAAAAGATINLARINTGTTLWWGFSATVWRDHGGVGQSFGGTSGTASSVAQLTTPALAANSAVQVGINDWNASTIATPSWQVINGSAMTGTVNVTGASHSTALGAYRTDAGAAGTEVVGLTTPATLRWVMVGVEILGAPDASGTTYAAAGTVAASSSLVGRAAVMALAAGSIAGVSAVTGAGSVAPRIYDAAGAVAASSAVAGSATTSQASSSRVAGTSAVSGAASVISPAAGTTAATTSSPGAGSAVHATRSTTVATSAVSGAASIVGGPVTHLSSGTVAVVSTVAGRAVVQFASAGRAASSASVAGAGSILGGPLVHQASGVVLGITATTGTATYVAATSGTVAATSGTTGAADTYDPDYVPPELEVGPVAPPRFTAAAARESTITATRTGHSVSAGPARPHRYRRQQ